jgi:hypothetical protein
VNVFLPIFLAVAAFFLITILEEKNVFGSVANYLIICMTWCTHTFDQVISYGDGLVLFQFLLLICYVSKLDACLIASRVLLKTNLALGWLLGQLKKG